MGAGTMGGSMQAQIGQLTLELFHLTPRLAHLLPDLLARLIQVLDPVSGLTQAPAQPHKHQPSAQGSASETSAQQRQTLHAFHRVSL